MGRMGKIFTYEKLRSPVVLHPTLHSPFYVCGDPGKAQELQVGAVQNSPPYCVAGLLRHRRRHTIDVERAVKVWDDRTTGDRSFRT